MLFIVAEYSFLALNYKMADCGGSEDTNAKQAGIVYVAKLLTHCGKNHSPAK